MKINFTFNLFKLFLFLTLLLNSFSLKAGSGIWDFGLRLQGVNYTLNNTSGWGANIFNGFNIGNVTSLYLDEARAYTWKDANGNVCSVTLNYRITKQGNTPGSFTNVNIPWNSDMGSGNQLWLTSPGTNLLSGLELGETYNFEIYYQYTGSTSSSSGCGGTYYQNNGGTNYTATFTYGNVYWWIGGNGSTTHAWLTTAYWSASRGGSAVGSITSGSNTVFIFDGSCMSTSCSISSGTITLIHGGSAISAAKILLKNNANVTYQPGTTSRSITLSGGVGIDFDIPSGRVVGQL